jgi:hypothetical protein
MADIDALLAEKRFDLTERKEIADLHHIARRMLSAG